MKAAVISDVHSNRQALERVRNEIEKMGIDVVCFAGDLVGYGADPNGCSEIVSGLATVSVLGNHDLAAMRKDPSNMNPHAAKAIMWTAEHIDERTKTYLRSLGESESKRIGEKTIELHHGSLRSVWEYLYEDDVGEDLLDSTSADVLVFGHTHVPFVKRYGRRMIVNPGSVGQPRDGDPRASFAVIDTPGFDCRIVRAEYDIAGAARDILRAGLPEMLAERLQRGY